MKEVRYIGEDEETIKKLQAWCGLGRTFKYCGTMLTVIGHYKVSHPLAAEQLKHIPVPIYNFDVEIRTPLLRAEFFSVTKGEFIYKDFTFDMLEVLKVHNPCMP